MRHRNNSVEDRLGNVQFLQKKFRRASCIRKRQVLVQAKAATILKPEA
jgi:hypothetical protein